MSTANPFDKCNHGTLVTGGACLYCWHDRYWALDAYKEKLIKALHETTYRLHGYRQKCMCLSMRGICPICTKTLQIENDVTKVIKERP